MVDSEFILSHAGLVARSRKCECYYASFRAQISYLCLPTRDSRLGFLPCQVPKSEETDDDERKAEQERIDTAEPLAEDEIVCILKMRIIMAILHFSGVRNAFAYTIFPHLVNVFSNCLAFSSQAEREELLTQGFANWSKRDYSQVCNAHVCELTMAECVVFVDSYKWMEFLAVLLIMQFFCSFVFFSFVVHQSI